MISQRTEHNEKELNKMYLEYKQSRDQENSKLSKEINCIENCIIKYDDCIKRNNNFDDNEILPKMKAVMCV